MYHYKESGLPNVYLRNGYREVATPYGPSVVISDVYGLHRTIATAVVSEKPHLTGPEVKFIRKFLEKTQAELATLLGVEDQSVRRWEKLPRVPKAADRAVRLIFLDIVRQSQPKLPHMQDIVQHTVNLDEELGQVNLRFRPNAKDRWQPDFQQAA